MSDFGCKTEKVRTESGLKLLILRPKRQAEQLQPGILWIHGGGYATGMASMVHMSRAGALVKKYGAVVLSPRLPSGRKASLPRRPGGLLRSPDLSGTACRPAGL